MSSIRSRPKSYQYLQRVKTTDTCLCRAAFPCACSKAGHARVDVRKSNCEWSSGDVSQLECTNSFGIKYNCVLSAPLWKCVTYNLPGDSSPLCSHWCLCRSHEGNQLFRADRGARGYRRLRQGPHHHLQGKHWKCKFNCKSLLYQVHNCSMLLH